MPGSAFPETEAAQANQRLGRYQVVAPLGHGGMGTIHLAVAGGLGAFRKLLVVKELRRDLARNGKFVDMFLAEARLAAQLNHPNIVHTLEAGREGDRYFLAMEFLDGQTYSALLKRAEQPPQIGLPVRIQILCEALAGLHYIHELCDYGGTHLKIVHRDVSPQNVFVTYDGQVKLLDFGIAKAADVESLTNPGVFKGKFAYASPEQVKGMMIDRRSDVFSMGVMLWEAVAMRRFAKGPATAESVDARLAGSELRLSQAVPNAEPLLAEICDKALHVDPDSRYASAEDFRSALQQFLLLNGETPNAALIGRTAQAKFANERAEMHRLIDAHLKQGDFSESMVEALRPSSDAESWQQRASAAAAPPPEASRDSQENPTTVADLSKLVPSSRREKADSEPPAAETVWPSNLRSNGRRFWIGVGFGGACALAGLVLAATRGPTAHPAAASHPSDVQAPHAALPLLTATPIETERMAALRETPSTASPEPAPSPLSPPAGEAAQGNDSESESEVSARRRERASQARPGASDARPARRGRRRDDAARSKTTPEPPPARSTKDPVRPSALEQPKLTATAQDRAWLDDDIRALNKRARRPLDLEDPFR